DVLLSWGDLPELARRCGRRQTLIAARAVLDRLREKIKTDQGADVSLDAIGREVVRLAESAAEPSLRAVINATGVILHTNLGRAPLAPEAVRHVAEVASQYSNLEYDLEAGERGKRDTHTERLFSNLLGAETALVVNNNAAAVFLALNTLAEGAEVIVSRGELIEIGGSFRIPDICAKSGAVLREAGTTNRTRISDYEAAITERTRLVLRVHPSNFWVGGFTERPSLQELAELAARRHLILMEDLGSGCVLDLAPLGIKEEPLIAESLKTGVDVVTFSGDKLLGGPQAGILLGRREHLSKIRKNPLFRALRVDKLTIAALEATLALYLKDDLSAIPAQRMMRASKEEVAARASALAGQLARLPGLTIALQDGESVAGGGSTPGQSLPTKLVAITHRTRTAQSLAVALRANRPPIIARVEEDHLLLDLRTVLNVEQEQQILEAFERLAC
ncbi:MAG TPA: L-seryl-tRNA(Sec) selenium transferase, partial [Terriglobia bacterium]|nr:L-seryl-tRNA(Sec) selenium transferase [Terriglobia bacterium]